MSASTQKEEQQKAQRKLGVHVSPYEHKPLAVCLRAKGQRCSPPTRKWYLNALTNPWPVRQKGVSSPSWMPCLSQTSQSHGVWHQACSHSLTSQISESSGGSFLSWRRRAKTCSEWTLLSVRRLTSFISIRGNIKWSWGNHCNKILKKSTKKRKKK